ncbi:50S ribosomal protein L25/general stress protein Ctc [Pseudoxanthobacter sp.]|uniref:50S ribosomal protein L25/general stress protein Ctc n=1 Tax=Pseudoxanthobacter sp. TaxID=1925742 RepID=UPI002FDFA14E
MSRSYELVATVRDRVGKGAARALRRENKVPAVIYGAGQPALPIALPEKEIFLKLHAGGFLTTIAVIDTGAEKIRVIPRDYQLDPVRDTLVHVDFLRVAAHAHIEVEVPVHFLNEEAAPGLKRGGVLNVVAHAVTLNVDADEIPEALTVDLTGLEIGDSVHLSQLALPAGSHVVGHGEDLTIATIVAPAVLPEDETAAAEAEAPAAPAAPQA